MIVSIHQPDYIPYIGYFYKIFKSDIFIFLDDAQYSSDNIHNWNRIKTSQGINKLKIPVKNSLGDPINGVSTRDELKWKKKHLRALEMNYTKAKYFKELYPDIHDLIMEDYQNIADMNIAIVKFISEKFGFKAKFIKSSDFEMQSKREEKVIELVSEVNGTVYLSGNGAKAYQVEDNFTSKGIELLYSDYKSIEYPQLWKEFEPNMSILDYIFNCGYDFDYIEKQVEEANGNR